MKCYRHYEMDAVSQCLDCGKALCPECTNKWTIPICDACNLKRANNDSKNIKKNVLGGRQRFVRSTILGALLFSYFR